MILLVVILVILVSLSDLVMFTGVLHTPDVGEGMTCTS